MTKRTLLALSALISTQAFASQPKLSYLDEKVNEASGIVNEFETKMKAFATGLNKKQIETDFAALDEHELEVLFEKTRFKQIQGPLMKAMEGFEPLKFKLTVQTGGYTASDIVPAVIDPLTDKLLGFCIIKRKDTINGVTKETYATLGGFHEYGLTYAENGAKEALEEAQIDVPLATIAFVGLYDDPKRDPRQHVSSLAFTGATFDMPQKTAEAREVHIWTADQIRAIPNNQWFGSDHKQIALDAIQVFKANEAQIRAALNKAKPRSTVEAAPEAAPAPTPKHIRVHGKRRK